MSEDFAEECLSPSLIELVECRSMQWIFVGGKGGVGKTTTSCSLAVQLALRRENVLILSTDPAHNLSDAFTQKFSNSPTKVNGFDNLFAMEIDSTMRTSTSFKLQEEDEFGLGKMVPELLSAFPGIDEALSFAELMQAVQTMNYSCIVFDTAPTGHTLRLLSFPDLLEKAFQKFNNLKEKMAGAINMMNALGGEAQDEMGKKFEKMRAVTTSVREMFRDPTRTTFVCVCIPEFLSVYETERLVQELSRQDIDASYIVVNQILFPILESEKYNADELAIPDEKTVTSNEGKSLLMKLKKLHEKATALEKSHLARRRMQSKYLSQIRDLYGYDFHLVPMPLQSDEVRGLESLRAFGTALMEERELPILESRE